MEINIEMGWKKLLEEEFTKDYFRKLMDFIGEEYRTKTIYPKKEDIFNAFNLSLFEYTKVVIIGQDPYHQPNQAHGLAFSVPKTIPCPPSLKNIYKEIELDLGIPSPSNGDLSNWAKQGVLMINATLTVEANRAGSHQNKGWEEFTDSVIYNLAKEKQGLVFLLWGSFAQKKASFIDPNNHLILKSVHPSPLSAYRGFFGNNHFSKTNNYLISQGKEPIDW